MRLSWNEIRARAAAFAKEWAGEGYEKGQTQLFYQAVLEARAAHPDASLADLYDPDLMPANLRKAHRALDHAVDRLYRRSSDRERVEHLLGLYEKMTEPMTAAAMPKRKRRKS